MDQHQGPLKTRGSVKVILGVSPRRRRSVCPRCPHDRSSPLPPRMMSGRQQRADLHLAGPEMRDVNSHRMSRRKVLPVSGSQSDVAVSPRQYLAIGATEKPSQSLVTQSYSILLHPPKAMSLPRPCWYHIICLRCGALRDTLKARLEDRKVGHSDLS